MHWVASRQISGIGRTIRTVEKAGKRPADSRDMVTSPGRTATDVLPRLGKGGFGSLFVEAAAAAARKEGINTSGTLGVA